MSISEARTQGSDGPYLAASITPHACRAPALPVGCVVKSSAFSWMITALPMMLVRARQRHRLSTKSTRARP